MLLFTLIHATERIYFRYFLWRFDFLLLVKSCGGVWMQTLRHTLYEMQMTNIGTFVDAKINCKKCFCNRAEQADTI